MIKYIQVSSDLHLEGFLGRDPEILVLDFIPKDERDVESMLILAGDISSHPDQLIGFLKGCLKRFQKVLFIPGNHEWYKHDYIAWNRTMDERFREHCPGLIFATGQVHSSIIDEVRYIYGTLWGDGGPTLADQAQVGFYLNDFRLISMPGYGDMSNSPAQRRFTTNDMIDIHKAHKKAIEDVLKQPFNGKTVVITHHMPSRELVSARFWPRDGSDGANGGFVGDCRNLIAVHEPDLWIHGHTHDRISTKLWKTRIECNPAGYRGEWATEHNTFMQVKWENGQQNVQAVPVFVRLSDLEVDPSPSDRSDAI